MQIINHHHHHHLTAIAKFVSHKKRTWESFCLQVSARKNMSGDLYYEFGRVVKLRFFQLLAQSRGLRSIFTNLAVVVPSLLDHYYRETLTKHQKIYEVQKQFFKSFNLRATAASQLKYFHYIHTKVMYGGTSFFRSCKSCHPYKQY